jgi:hypothetical protein
MLLRRLLFAYCGNRSVFFRRVEAGLRERVRHGDVFDVRGMRVENFSRVARDGRGEECIDQFAIHEQRMPVLAIVLRRDGP